MKAVILLCTIITVIDSRPQFGIFSEPARILRNEVFNTARGFSFNVDTSDGFHHDAQGELQSDTGNEEDEGLEVHGSYSYIGDDGRNYTVEYTAGKNGFEPAGTHLPPSAGVKKLGFSPGCDATLCGTQLG